LIIIFIKNYLKNEIIFLSSRVSLVKNISKLYKEEHLLFYIKKCSKMLKKMVIIEEEFIN
jgi:hypothetical protein